MANRSRKSMRNKMKAIEQAKALLESKTMYEAYKKTHPDSTEKSAKKNAHRMWNNPELLVEFQKAIQMDKPMTVSRDSLEKLLMMVVVRWANGMERTSDYLKAVETLSRLVPDFKDRKEISEYEKMSPEQLDQEILRYNRLISEEQGKN